MLSAGESLTEGPSGEATCPPVTGPGGGFGRDVPGAPAPEVMRSGGAFGGGGFGAKCGRANSAASVLLRIFSLQGLGSLADKKPRVRR